MIGATSAQAQKGRGGPPNRQPPGDADFLPVDVDNDGTIDFGEEIVGGVTGGAESTYRTVFGTGNVVVAVTATSGDVTLLDDRPFLFRFSSDVTGQRHFLFRIGLPDGKKHDRYSTPTPDEGIGMWTDNLVPFPEVVWYRSSGGNPPTSTPWLEVVAGSVDPITLDMEPGAHVILHLNVADVPLYRMSGSQKGEFLGTISFGDIEFTLPDLP